MSSDSTLNSDSIARSLQMESGGVGPLGRTILTVMYLIVLTICFIMPILYYFKMKCDDQNEQRRRQHVTEQLRTALQNSVNMSLHYESTAVQRKFVEERRARILQLFTPVRMVGVRYSLQFSCLLNKKLLPFFPFSFRF
jgi:hypothetical protein